MEKDKNKQDNPGMDMSEEHSAGKEEHSAGKDQHSAGKEEHSAGKDQHSAGKDQHSAERDQQEKDNQEHAIQRNDVQGQAVGDRTAKLRRVRPQKNSSKGEKPGEQAKLEQAKAKLEKLSKDKTRSGKAMIIAVAAVAVIVLIICVIVFINAYNSRITVVTSIGDVTFTDKWRQEDECFVTFQAAAFNCLPADMNEQGITVQIDQDIYGALVLDVKYSSVSVVFDVPKPAARKSGFKEEQANVQALWKEDVVKQYAKVKTIVWSTDY